MFHMYIQVLKAVRLRTTTVFEPVATEEELAVCVEQVTVEEEQEAEFKKRFSREVNFGTW